MTQKLIHKYFSGECTPDEEALVKAYLDGGDLTVLNEYLDEVANADAPAPLSQKESDELLGSIHHQVQVNELMAGIFANTDTVSGQNKKHKNLKHINTGHQVIKPRRYINWRVAASLVFLLACGGLAFNLWKQKTITYGIKQGYEQWSTIDNNTAGVKKAVLADGTIVWLNSGSSLAYQSAKFDQSTREVKVNGEVFFDVAHNAQKPFIVHTGKVSTRVLGTAFNIEAYSTEAETKVTLVRGSVRVKAGNDSLTLAPGQMLKYLHQTKHSAVTIIDTRQTNAWTTGKISFSDVALDDALKRLSAIYNVKIAASNPGILNNKRITGVFDRKPVDRVLANILYVYGLKCEKKGGEFIIQQ